MIITEKEKTTEKLEKKAYKKVLLEQKKIKKNERNIIYRKKNEPPKLSLLEEIGNSITHGFGALLAIIGLVAMLSKSKNELMVASSIVYCLSMFLMMLMSCLYHAFKSGSKVKRIWRRFDYSSIYLLIGGTFTPLLLVELGGTLGLVWFFVMWILIIIGITMVCIFGPGRLKWLHFPLYFIIGWSGVFLIPHFIESNMPLLWWILAGGFVYTFGMIPFAKRGVKCAHFIWHFFVLCAAIVHFLGIYLCVY